MLLAARDGASNIFREVGLVGHPVLPAARQQALGVLRKKGKVARTGLTEVWRFRAVSGTIWVAGHINAPIACLCEISRRAVRSDLTMSVGGGLPRTAGQQRMDATGALVLDIEDEIASWHSNLGNGRSPIHMHGAAAAGGANPEAELHGHGQQGAGGELAGGALADAAGQRPPELAIDEVNDQGSAPNSAIVMLKRVRPPSSGSSGATASPALSPYSSPGCQVLAPSEPPPADHRVQFLLPVSQIDCRPRRRGSKDAHAPATETPCAVAYSRMVEEVRGLGAQMSAASAASAAPSLLAPPCLLAPPPPRLLSPRGRERDGLLAMQAISEGLEDSDTP